MGTVWRVGRVACRCRLICDNEAETLASSRTWRHMELPAATKPTNANFVRVIRKKGSMNQGCHKRFYRHMFFRIIYFLTF